MKQALVFLLLALFLSGCASYKFQHGKAPYDKGYVVSRDGYIIPEYTLGQNNSAPDIKLARERFKKRKGIVEHYYKKMGFIENRFKMAFWDPPIVFLKTVGGVFRLPAIAISDYRYEHNPRYREKIRERERRQDAAEEARIQKLKDELGVYIERDLNKEDSGGN